MAIVENYPRLFDERGGARRRATRQREEEERRRLEAEERAALQTMSAVDSEEQLERSGSLQLGGEPEDRQDNIQAQRHVIRPPAQPHDGLGLESGLSLDSDLSNLSLNSRGLTPQQQQQMLLQQFKDSPGQSSAFVNQQGGPFQGHPSQASNPPGHARNVSRYSFANDTSSASAAVKPVANQKLMSQQSNMMPSQGGPSQQQQPFYTSTVSGPPPGLKTTGTPPVSGGGMFGQGHGFATSGIGYGSSATGRNSNDEMVRELMRRRDIGGGQADAGKREYMPSSFSHASTSATPISAPGLLNFPYHSQSSVFADAGAQKAKKKGKKHRHANTPSSGGGVVDVADPSILQARLHQGGSAGGQGLYGGQGQGGLHSVMYGGGGFGNRW